MVGEHIRALKDGRWIHAIDCGDETVLLLAADPAPPRVRRAYRPEFVAGARSVEAVTHRERTFPPDEVVRRAYSRAADPALATMFGDSEAFAEWCTSGRLRGARNVAVAIPGTAAEPPPPRTAPPRAARRPRAKATAKPAKRSAGTKRPARRSGSKRGVSPRAAARRRTALRASRPARRKRGRR